MGGDELCAAGGSARPAVCDRSCGGGASRADRVGCPGAVGEFPGGKQRGGEVTLKGAPKGRSRPWLLAVIVLCCVLGAVVQACGGSDSSGGGGSTKKVDMAAELKKPQTITVWAWTPGTDEAVKMFEKAYPNIHVKLQNVGQGSPHYRKVRTVLKSGKGLPDVIHMEFQYIPSFTITKSLLDMTPYLPKDFLSKYPEWIQKQINLQNAIY